MIIHPTKLCRHNLKFILKCFEFQAECMYDLKYCAIFYSMNFGMDFVSLAYSSRDYNAAQI